MSQAFQAYVIKHWAEDGETSGASIVVARTPLAALGMLKLHFDSKPPGFRQYWRMDMLEIERYDESMFAEYPLTDKTAGFKAEYRIHDEGHDSLVHLGCDVPRLAQKLDDLQAPIYEGRGVSCVRTLVEFLRRGQLAEARACARNESDKIRSHPQIVAELKRIGIWREIDFNRQSRLRYSLHES